MSKNSQQYKSLTDEILFNRYVGGDLQAFEQLLLRNKNLIYSLILRYVSASHLADEIFQEVFLKVCRNKELFREFISFKAWIATICKNTCIDFIRSQNRTLKTQSFEDTAELESGKAFTDIPDAETATPDKHVTLQNETQELTKLLDKLPVEQRETFYMKTMMEMTFEEIGEAMNCSTNTVKSRHRYALETLRALLNRKKFFNN